MNEYLISVGKSAKIASQSLLEISQEKLNQTLISAAKLIRENKVFLQENNAIDIENAKQKGQSAGLLIG